jgi:hypothetical protein
VYKTGFLGVIIELNSLINRSLPAKQPAQALQTKQHVHRAQHVQYKPLGPIPMNQYYTKHVHRAQHVQHKPLGPIPMNQYNTRCSG